MIIAALVLPAALGLAALAIEGGLWYADHHTVRNIADSAVLSAGWARRDGDAEDTAAQDGADDGGFDADTDQIDFVSPPSSGNYAGDNQAIEVVVRRTRPLYLSTLFLDSSADIVIEARAVVRLNTRSSYCLLALDGAVSGAVTMQGAADVVLEGCGITANSNAANALNMNGGATVAADWIEVVGGIDDNGNIDATEIDTNASSRPDPYADLVFPMAPPCTYSGNFTVNANQTQSVAGGARFCGDVTIKGTLNLAPGNYYFDGNVKFQGTVTGTDVSLFLVRDIDFDVNAQANVDLSAAISGEYAGIALMQESGGSQMDWKFNGGAAMNIEGVIYAPDADVTFTGGSSAGAGCTRIVASTITFSGNATLGNDCSALGLDTTIDDDPVLVE